MALKRLSLRVEVGAFHMILALLILWLLLARPEIEAGSNAGFNMATPVGLFLAALLVAASSLDLTEERAAPVMRHQNLLPYGLWAVTLAWAFVSPPHRQGPGGRRPRVRAARTDRPLLESSASQLSVPLENARLYRQTEGIFHSYMSPEVATGLLPDPARARLEGAAQPGEVVLLGLHDDHPTEEELWPSR